MVECFDSSCKVFVGNVPYSISENEFKTYFDKYDGFVNAELASKNNNTRGIGFVIFKNSNFVDKFLNNMEKIVIKNRELRISKYHNKNDNDFFLKSYNKNIFVHNIPKNFTNDNLKKIFSKFGKVTLAYIYNKTNTGYVEFENEATYYKVMSFKNICIDDTILYISANNKKEKYNINEIYKIAFNAGKKYAETQIKIENKL
jgi:polyadenylate-binding protein